MASRDEITQEITDRFGQKVRVRTCGICIEQEKILMVKHHYIGQQEYLWAPPGGGIQFGESAQESLKREFLEETGLVIAVGEFLFVYEFRAPPLHAVELFFDVKRIEGRLKKGYDPEISAENQIIAEVGFLSLETLNRENPLQIHGVFRNIENLSFILEKRGYYQSIH